MPYGVRHRSAAGFTLIELITVILIFGVLAAVAVPQLMQDDSQDRAVAGQVLDSLRQAQRMAVTHNREVCVVVTSKTVRFSMALSAGLGIACSAVPANPSDSGETLDVIVAAAARQSFAPTGNFRFRPDGVLTNNAGNPLNVARSLSVLRSVTAIAVFTIQPDNSHVQASYF